MHRPRELIIFDKNDYQFERIPIIIPTHCHYGISYCILRSSKGIPHSIQIDYESYMEALYDPSFICQKEYFTLKFSRKFNTICMQKAEVIYPEISVL